MDNTSEGAAAASVPTPLLRVQFQSAEDFEKEADVILQRQKAMKAALGAPQKKKKKEKQTVNPDILVAEQNAVKEIEGTNWIGKIIEYRNAHPTAAAEGLKFVEEITGSSTIPRFSYKVVIFETSNQFGADAVTFSNKKSAKQYACKQAIDWLIENKHMPADGSVKFPKVAPPPPPPAPRRESSGSNTQNLGDAQLSSISYAGQVPALCHRLGFNTPTYHINPVSPNAPVYDAWAEFPEDTRIDGIVGVTKNVHGKKNAKEGVARLVVSFLLEIEKHRMSGLESSLQESWEEEHKKRKRSTDSIGREEDTDKPVRLQS